MHMLTLVCALAIVLIVYLVIGFGFMLATVAIWKSDWITWRQRMFAASFFPFAYFFDGKVEQELSYPVFGRQEKLAYVIITTLSWPRLIFSTGIALFFGFCRAFNQALGDPPEPMESKDDESAP